MEAQQIRLNINELVNGIHDEAFLSACFQAVEGIAKAYQRVAGSTNGIAPAKKAKPKAAPTKETPVAPLIEKTAEQPSLEANEKSLPHDLSLVFLANEIFKGSEPAPPEASLAFRRALLKSATYEPTLPNRR